MSYSTHLSHIAHQYICNMLKLNGHLQVGMICWHSAILDKLDDDVLLWLDLEHLEDEADKWCWLDVASEHSAREFQLHGLVHQQLGRESKTVFFPIFRVINSRPRKIVIEEVTNTEAELPDNFLDQILWIRSFDCDSIFHCPIRHTSEDTKVVYIITLFKRNRLFILHSHFIKSLDQNLIFFNYIFVL